MNLKITGITVRLTSGDRIIYISEIIYRTELVTKLYLLIALGLAFLNSRGFL